MLLNSLTSGEAGPRACPPARTIGRVAVCLPCHDEAAAIAKVVADFRRELPDAAIYVYDNNSRDATAAIAQAAGATVRKEPRQGKGHVVRRMFADIEADVYVMVDADDTYDPKVIGRMVDRLVDEGLDMVVGARKPCEEGVYRPGHALGNRLLGGLVRAIFGEGYNDMLSGYRVFSRRFVKSFPVMSGGFEIETELTIHALELEMPSAELPIAFSERAVGSESKLRTFRDGFRILRTIAGMLRQERPFMVFSVIAALLALTSVGLAAPVLLTYAHSGLVPRLPTAVLASALMLLAFLSLFCGLILQTVTRGRKEAKRMRYLAIPGIASSTEHRI